MRVVKVAIDCRAARTRMSGVGRYVVNLVEHLAQDPACALTLIASPDLNERLQALPGVRVMDAGKGAAETSRVGRFRWEQGSLARLLRNLGADLYHATWNYGVPWNSPCPSVVTVHDLIPMYVTETFGSRRARAAFVVGQYISMLKASRIIAVSQSTRKEVARFAPWAARVCGVVLQGVDPQFSAAAERFPRRSEYLLYIGGFESRKNLDGLLRGYELAVSDHGVGLPLWLSGTVDRLSPTVRQAFDALSPGTRGLIRFLGDTADAEMPGLYRGAAALVFPSRLEGFGYPPLEAMACGTPVITTRCGGIPEATGESAAFVDPDSPSQLAEAITRVVCDESYASQLACRGLAHAKTMTWTAAATATRDVYLSAGGRC